MNSTQHEKEQIVKILAKFKADLLWDEMAGVLEKVPAHIQERLKEQYLAALRATSLKLEQPVVELQEEVEQQALQLIDGQSYGPEDIRARLREYGIMEG